MTVVTIATRNYKFVCKGESHFYDDIKSIVQDKDNPKVVRLVKNDNWQYLINTNTYRIEII